jgi:hypothetical protein
LAVQSNAIMKKLVLIAAVVVAASPAGAQLAAPNDQVSSSTQGAAAGTARGATGSTQAPSTGVFCIEEMTATFCNVVTGPNTGGYGTRSRSGSGSAGGGTATSAAAGAGGGTSALPPCPAEPPFNELCD